MEIGGIHLDRSTLLQYERGTVGAPDPIAVWALAETYGATVGDLIRLLITDRAQRPVSPVAVNEERRRLLEAFDHLSAEERHSIFVLVERNRARPRRRDQAARSSPPAVAQKAPSRVTSATRRLRRAQ